MKYLRSCFLIAADLHRGAYIMLFLAGVVPFVLFGGLFTYARISEEGMELAMFSAAVLLVAMAIAEVIVDHASFGGTLSRDSRTPEILKCAGKGNGMYRDALIGDQLLRALYHLVLSVCFTFLWSLHTRMTLRDSLAAFLVIALVSYGVGQCGVFFNRLVLRDDLLAGAAMATTIGSSAAFILVGLVLPERQTLLRDMMKTGLVAVTGIAGIALAVYQVKAGVRRRREEFADRVTVLTYRMRAVTKAPAKRVSQNRAGGDWRTALRLIPHLHSGITGLIFFAIFTFFGIAVAVFGEDGIPYTFRGILPMSTMVLVYPLFTMSVVSVTGTAEKRKKLQTTGAAQLCFLTGVFTFLLIMGLRALMGQADLPVTAWLYIPLYDAAGRLLCGIGITAATRVSLLWRIPFGMMYLTPVLFWPQITTVWNPLGTIAHPSAPVLPFGPAGILLAAVLIYALDSFLLWMYFRLIYRISVNEGYRVRELGR